MASLLHVANILRTMCTPSTAEVKHTNVLYSDRSTRFVSKLYQIIRYFAIEKNILRSLKFYNAFINFL